MRVLLIFIFGFSSHVGAQIEPCAAEKHVVENTNNSTAETQTLLLELRTMVRADKESRDQSLANDIQDAEAKLYNASQALLQETQLLQTLNGARPRLDRLTLAIPRLDAFRQLPERPSPAASLIAVLQTQSSSIDGEAVADIQLLVQLIRTLEKSSRNWRTMASSPPPTSLAETLQKVLDLHVALNESVLNGPEMLASLKRKITDVQTTASNSVAQRQEKEARIGELDRRLALLRQTLPSQKATLQACTRRALFGE